MSRRTIKNKKPLVIHPFLFGVLPVLFLYVHNLQFVTPADLLWPLIFAGVVSLGFWLVLGVLIRDPVRRGIIVTLTALSIIMYSRIPQTLTVLWDSISGSYWRGIALADLLGPLIWLMLVITLGLTVTRISWDLNPVNRYFNLLGILLTGSLVFQIGVATCRAAVNVRGGSMKKEVSTREKSREKNLADLPHVFYIILDGYARDDVLEEIYQLDNSSFTGFLRGQGFYVATDSYANYPMTPFSVAASMNGAYLPELAGMGKNHNFEDQPDFDMVKGLVTRTTEMIRQGEVVRHFREAGYRIGAFDSRFDPTSLKDADCYLSPGESMSEFQKVLVEMTPFLGLFRKGYYDGHRDRFTFILDNLEGFAEKQEPHFVFAHVVCPHPPFVIDAQGNRIYPARPYSSADASDFFARGGTTDEYLAGYREQLEYLNRRLMEVIPAIIKQSRRPVVILLQSDHGPGSRFDWYDYRSSYLVERFGILNAYYFHDGDYDQLYPSISPVNSFRVVKNRYFNTHLSLLEDRSIFVSWYEQDRKEDYFVDITSLLSR